MSNITVKTSSVNNGQLVTAQLTPLSDYATTNGYIQVRSTQVTGSPNYGGYNPANWSLEHTAVDNVASSIPLLTNDELIKLKNMLIDEAANRNIPLFDKVTIDI